MSTEIVASKPMLSITSFTNDRVEDGVLIVKNNVTNQEERYVLTEIPNEETKLVFYQKQDALGAVDLKKLLFQLQLCVDLYEITYNAVNGIDGLAADVTELRLRFGNTLRESDITAAHFKATTGGVVDSLMLAYNLLVENEKTLALKILASVSDAAAKMKEESARIATLFKTVRDDTTTTLGAVTKKNELFYKKIEEYQKQEAELKSSLAKYSSIADSCKTRSDRLQTQINETKADIKTQESNALTLSIISAISGSVSGIAEGVGKAMAGPGIHIGIPTSGSSDTTGSKTSTGNQNQGGSSSGISTQDVEAKKQYSESKNKLKQLTAEKNVLDEKKRLIDEVLDDKNKTKKDKLTATIQETDKTDTKDYSKMTDEQLQQEKDQIKSAIEMKKTEIEHQTETTDNYRASLQVLGYAFDSVSGDLKELSAQSEQKSGDLRTTLSDLRTQQFNVDSLYADSLAKVCETTARLANALNGKKDVEVAVDSLILAIGALNNVISFLEMITLFWAKIEVACGILAKNNADINKLATDGDAAFFKKSVFAFPYFKSLAYWVALNCVFAEYLDAADQAHLAYTNSLQKTEKRREDHWETAKILAKAINEKLGREIAVTNKKIALLGEKE